MADSDLMAHFAELDETNTVLNVVVVGNDVTTIDGVEDEQRGIDFLNDLLPESGTWVQTSYNRNIRFDYAAVGGTYDPVLDIFIQPKPFPSWVLDDTNHSWWAPVDYPGTDEPPFYYWDEDNTIWVEIEMPEE